MTITEHAQNIFTQLVIKNNLVDYITSTGIKTNARKAIRLAHIFDDVLHENDD